LVATGHAPLTTQALKRLRATGVRTINYSTDDPWNPAHRAQWHLDALPEYDTVFTPRRANLRDFERLGCRKVRYLPFGYDDELFAAREPRQTRSGPDALFVGGADADRVDFIRRFRCVGLHPTLVGAYWNRYPEFAGLAAGLKNPDELAAMTAAAKVNLCLVRRANRDGHVMRSFEIPAVGGFVLAEDTAEHRDLFGEEGTRVLYFRSPEEAGEKTKWALDHPGERQRMARAAYELVTSGPHTYKARLTSILSDVATVAM
jgi:spore maturation protein CgeB